MTDRLRITVLGCASSGGVPRIGPEGPNWGACDPANSRNRRRRCALLVQRFGPDGTTTVLIDAGPDVREQLIEAGAGWLDAVVLTHDHADHVHGIDDLRMVVFNRRQRLPCWMDARTADTMHSRFGYVFETPDGSAYPPIMDDVRIDGPVVIEGKGGPVTCLPFHVPHGNIDALGFRIGPVVYTPDISAMSDAAWAALDGAECWITDALRYREHPSHANVATAIAWIRQADPPRAFLTNLHVDIDYDTLDAQTPDHVHPAYDGLALEYPAEPG
ncbi:MAG: MBL fold metallo-hydrolase [Pseudomonadota bacterium]